MKTIYANLEPVPGVALQHQITAFLRGLIRGGKLANDERLPNVRDLAVTWATSHFTVQAAITPLVAEGLIVRRPRLGTFVKSPPAKLSTVGVYHNHRPRPSPEDAFSTAVHTAVCRRLAADGIKVLPWFDMRPEDEQGTPLPETVAAVDGGNVQAVVGTAVRVANLQWLSRLKLPLALVTTEIHPAAVGTDAGQMVKTALGQLGAKGCRRVGMITHISPPASESPVRRNPSDLLLYQTFQDECRRLGMTTDPAWILAPPTHPASFEKCGYDLFHQLWRQPVLPDGLFVFPDVMARGVFQAILELKVRVPEELQLTVHRNDEIDLFSPFPVNWIEVRVQDFADALLDQIERQLRGEDVRYRPILLHSTP